ncbi:MAG: radical SAM protein [Candidatus Bathyarchaeota archaeon]|nr:radical SAM protein [Candidatus Bathyarchaeota archaeon]MDH5787408.1 radical SAM protein [Candidatus Bathyarchaeota archaeon]
MTLEKAASIAIRSLTPNRPYHVQWMLTRRCNYNCKGCDVWQEQDGRELSSWEIKRGLDVLRELGAIEVVLSGGNPLLRDDIDEIIEYASRSFITTIYDNGSMAVEKIDALRNADFVAISIDSLDPARNDHIKGVKGAWKKAMQAVEKLHDEGISVTVSPTISQLNLYEIADFTRFFLQKGIPLWYCLYSYDSSEDLGQIFRIGKENDEFIITDREAMVKLCDFLIEMRRKNGNIFMTTRILKAIKDLYLRDARTWKCRALQNFFMVDHLGRVAGCHLHSSVASIFDLRHAWHSKKFNSLRKIYSDCTQCTYLCYIFYSIHGSVFGNIKIAQEQWKSAKLFLRRDKTKPANLTSPVLKSY